MGCIWYGTLPSNLNIFSDKNKKTLTRQLARTRDKMKAEKEKSTGLLAEKNR
jgi:hypothetical protein